MRTGERKSCGVVIKRSTGPVLFAVTRIALLAELTVVRIVIAMAADAGLRRVSMFRIGCMAVRTGKANVRSVQNKIGARMIEFGLIEINYDRVSALVVGVATRTILLLELRQVAVQARLFIEIISHIGMTLDTRFKLWPVGQWIVAAPARFFDFCVTANNRSRHQQPSLQAGGFRGSDISD